MRRSLTRPACSQLQPAHSVAKMSKAAAFVSSDIAALLPIGAATRLISLQLSDALSRQEPLKDCTARHFLNAVTKNLHDTAFFLGNKLTQPVSVQRRQTSDYFDRLRRIADTTFTPGFLVNFL
jgi:hypothetical protein